MRFTWFPSCLNKPIKRALKINKWRWIEKNGISGLIFANSRLSDVKILWISLGFEVMQMFWSTFRCFCIIVYGLPDCYCGPRTKWQFVRSYKRDPVYGIRLWLVTPLLNMNKISNAGTICFPIRAIQFRQWMAHISYLFGQDEIWAVHCRNGTTPKAPEFQNLKERDHFYVVRWVFSILIIWFKGVSTYFFPGHNLTFRLRPREEDTTLFATFHVCLFPFLWFGL